MIGHIRKSIAVIFATAAVVCAQSSSDTGSEFSIESAVLQIVETVEIPATATGPVQEVDVQQGGLIESGQVLATIDDQDARIRLEEAEIDLEIISAQTESRVDIEFAEKSRLVALADYRRAEESNRSYAGVVSAREMDRLKLLVEQSDAELQKIKFDKSIQQMQKKLKEAAVNKHKIEVERHKIKSALAGQVVEINKRAGEWVNVADPIFKIVRLDRLRVEEYLPAKVASTRLTGAAATFTADSAAKSDVNKINGRVVFVSPKIDPLNSTVLVWIEFDNRALRLRPGMKGRVTIRKDQMESDPARQAATNN